MNFEDIKDFDDIGFYVLSEDNEPYYDIQKANEYITKNNIQDGLSEKELEQFRIK